MAEAPRFFANILETPEAPRVYVCDFDGTLVDTKPFNDINTEAAFKSQGFPYRAAEFAPYFPGRTLNGFYRAVLMGEFGVNEQEAVVLVRRLCSVHIESENAYIYQVNCYPGVLETCEALRRRGDAFAIATNRYGQALDLILANTGLDEYFHTIVTPLNVKRPKPYPDMVHKALDILGLPKDRAVYVGDTGHDVVAGKKAGVKTAWVTYGYQSEGVIEHEPDHVLHWFDQLMDVEL